MTDSSREARSDERDEIMDALRRIEADVAKLKSPGPPTWIFWVILSFVIVIVLVSVASWAAATA